MRIILLSFLFLLLQSGFCQVSTDSITDSSKSDTITETDHRIMIDQAVSKQVQAKIIPIEKKEGKLEVNKDHRLELLIEGYKTQKVVNGYKIQLFSGRSRMDAIKVKSSFHSNYGESEKAYLIYQPPNFKIRVGNYRDRLSATKSLKLYKIDFPSAFIVEDEVEIDNQ